MIGDQAYGNIIWVRKPFGEQESLLNAPATAIEITDMAAIRTPVTILDGCCTKIEIVLTDLAMQSSVARYAHSRAGSSEARTSHSEEKNAEGFGNTGAPSWKCSTITETRSTGIFAATAHRVAIPGTSMNPPRTCATS